MTRCSIFSTYMQFNNFAWTICGLLLELSALTLATCFYALVPRYIAVHKVFMSLVLTSMLDYQYDVPPYKLDAQKGSLYTRAFTWILIARIDRDASL